MTKKLRSKFGKNAGFTLIELLTVISVIGFISSIVMTNVNSARAKARDAVRKQSLRQLQTALELYYQTNCSYPDTGLNVYSSEPSDVNAPVRGGNLWIPGLTPTYMANLPVDPRSGAQNAYCSGGSTWRGAFLYMSDGLDYKLMANCSPENMVVSGDVFNDARRDGGPLDTSTPTSCDGSGDGTRSSTWSVHSSSRARCW